MSYQATQIRYSIKLPGLVEQVELGLRPLYDCSSCPLGGLGCQPAEVAPVRAETARNEFEIRFDCRLTLTARLAAECQIGRGDDFSARCGRAIKRVSS